MDGSALDRSLVRIADLQKVYRTRDGNDIHALKDINLAIREREFIQAASGAAVAAAGS